MHVRLGVEDMEPNNWVAWAFELPGCYARGPTRDEAVAQAPFAVRELIQRLRKAGWTGQGYDNISESSVAEEFRAYPFGEDYLVNAFFENDRIPLINDDIEYADLLLGLNRGELLEIMQGMSQEEMERPIEGEVQGNIYGIIRHIGTAEWWYWDRLDMAFHRAERPIELEDLLRKVRRFTLDMLRTMLFDTRTAVKQGERWSARKLLRRTVWHERVHTLQIRRYLLRMREEAD